MPSSVILKSTPQISQKSPNPNPETAPNPQPTGERAIPVITLNTVLEKEFDLSMKEVNDFLPGMRIDKPVKVPHRMP